MNPHNPANPTSASSASAPQASFYPSHPANPVAQQPQPGNGSGGSGEGPTTTASGHSSVGWVGATLMGAALVCALGGWYYQSSQITVMRSELAHSRNQMSELTDKVQTANEEAKTRADESIARMNEQIAAAKKEAEANANRVQAGRAAQTNKTLTALSQRNEELVKQVGDLKKENEEKSAEIAEKLSGVQTEVGTVKTDIEANRNGLDETRTELRRAVGDMGVMSGLIATNASELAALKKLGDRDYIEFSLPKTGSVQKVGDIQLALKKTDVKRSRFTLDVLADDKKVEKKDKTANEPVQFYISKARQPYELVINAVEKDKVTGYLAIPKVRVMAQR